MLSNAQIILGVKMKANKNFILTANDLLEGDVIYWTKSADWSRILTDAVVFENADQANVALEAAEKDNMLVGPYLAEVKQDFPIATANHFREEFRATGPSNYFHGKQEQQNV